MTKGKDKQTTVVIDDVVKGQWAKRDKQYANLMNALRSMTGTMTGCKMDMETGDVFGSCNGKPVGVLLGEQYKKAIEEEFKNFCDTYVQKVKEELQSIIPASVPDKKEDSKGDVTPTKEIISNLAEKFSVTLVRVLDAFGIKILIDKNCGKHYVIDTSKFDVTVVNKQKTTEVQAIKPVVVQKPKPTTPPVEKQVSKQEVKAKSKVAKVVAFITKQVNTVKKAILFYAMGVAILLMFLWNITLLVENRELNLTKKEYLILRWHVNTKPESKAFMEKLDSFVNVEGVSPVYDRVVENIRENEK